MILPYGNTASMSTPFYAAAIGIIRAGKEKYGSAKALSEKSGVSEANISRWLKGTRKPRIEEAAPIFDIMGAEILLPEDRKRDSTRDVCWVDAKIASSGSNARPPKAENYLAVPMIGEAGAGPGMMPKNQVKSWILVHEPSIPAFRRTDLLAVEIGKNQTSMTPTLHPGDIVLVDRNDWGEGGIRHPGNIFLVRDPGQDGGGKIKRVTLTGRGEDEIITFYSDNADENEPEPHLMSEYEHDMRKAIVGKVVWAWADLSRK